MGYNSTDAARDAHDAERGDALLLEALSLAQEICRAFAERFQDDPLGPAISVELELGSDDQPVFVFTLLMEIDDDFDADEYPAEGIERLLKDLRENVADSIVDDWDWFVTTATKAGAAER